MKPGWGLSLAQLATIKAPTLLVFGDHDFTSLEEAGRIFHAIPASEALHSSRYAPRHIPRAPGMAESDYS